MLKIIHSCQIHPDWVARKVVEEMEKKWFLKNPNIFLCLTLAHMGNNI